MWKRIKKKKKTAVRDIYKTTDGYFTGNTKITKPRRVAVVEQRKDDGALAVVKIYSAKDKKGKMYIKGVVLSSEKHPSLTEDSIVGSQIHIGAKRGGKYYPFYQADFSPANDKLTKRECRRIKRKAGGESKKNRRTSKQKIKRWRRHFKE